jgi:hypothetical protein
MCEDPHEWKFIAIAVGWGSGHIWLHTTLEGLWPTTWFWRCVGMAFGLFFSGSHNFMVTALGLCVKWPLGMVHTHAYHGWHRCYFHLHSHMGHC